MNYDELTLGDIHKDYDTLFKEKDGKLLVNVDEIILVIHNEYKEKKLVIQHQDYTEILAICGVINPATKKWYTMTTPALIRCVPEKINRNKHNNESYVEYSFSKNGILLETLELMKSPKLVEVILSLILWRAIIPSFMTRDHIVRTLTKMSKFTGLNIDSSPAILEVLVSLICRDKEELRLVRYMDTTKNDIPIVYKGLSNRAFSTEHSFRMLIGGHESKAYPIMVTKNNNITTTVEQALR